MDIDFEEILNTDDEWSMQGTIATTKMGMEEEKTHVLERQPELIPVDELWSCSDTESENNDPSENSSESEDEKIP